MSDIGLNIKVCHCQLTTKSFQVGLSYRRGWNKCLYMKTNSLTARQGYRNCHKFKKNKKKWYTGLKVVNCLNHVSRMCQKICLCEIFKYNKENSNRRWCLNRFLQWRTTKIQPRLVDHVYQPVKYLCLLNALPVQTNTVLLAYTAEFILPFNEVFC